MMRGRRKFLWAKSLFFSTQKNLVNTLALFKNSLFKTARVYCGIMRGTSNDVMMDQKNQSKINSTNMQVYCSQCLQFLQKVSFDAVFNDETFFEYFEPLCKELEVWVTRRTAFSNFQMNERFSSKTTKWKKLFQVGNPILAK